MLWLTVKCANCADPDFQATTQLICDCSNHIILDVHSLDYRYWEQRGFLFFLSLSSWISRLSLAWFEFYFQDMNFYQETRFTMGLSLSGDKRWFYELQITWRVFWCIFFYLWRVGFWMWLSFVYCTCVMCIFVYMLLCFAMKTLPWLFPCAASLQALARGLAVRIMHELCISPSTVSLARWERSAACVAWHSYTASSANSAKSISKLCSPDSGSPIKE